MRTGDKNQALITGRITYGHDGTDSYPINTDTTGQNVTLLASTASVGKLAANSGVDVGDVDVITLPQREPFIFRPGSAAMASGVVASGTRSGGAALTGAGTADQTEWSPWVTYEPARGGKIDGLASGGVIAGQLTFGYKVGANTAAIKLTAEIRNKAGTAVVMMALTGTLSATTGEAFATYDLPQLLTVANMNAVPFEIRHGNRSNIAATAAITRVMESSYIQGEFEPGT